jgi:hypothetical protein
MSETRRRYGGGSESRDGMAGEKAGHGYSTGVILARLEAGSAPSVSVTAGRFSKRTELDIIGGQWDGTIHGTFVFPGSTVNATVLTTSGMDNRGLASVWVDFPFPF